MDVLLNKIIAVSVKRNEEVASSTTAFFLPGDHRRRRDSQKIPRGTPSAGEGGHERPPLPNRVFEPVWLLEIEGHTQLQRVEPYAVTLFYTLQKIRCPADFIDKTFCIFNAKP